VQGKFFDWLDHRIGHRKLLEALLLEHIPGGARWRYVWGSTLAFVFMIQLITGILLMTSYSASDASAWASVHYIQYQMDFGWLIRGLHHYGSQTMMVLIALHMLQVVIAGAHLPPRELNWWLGLGLLGVTFGLGLTGYLLPWDQKGYWATRVATNIASKTPLIGEHLQRFLVGGPDYGNHTLTRFFAFHVGLLPALFIILLILHLTAFRRHGVTHPPVSSRPEPAGFLPIVRDLILGACVAAVFYVVEAPLTTALLAGSVFWIFALSRVVVEPTPVSYFWPSQAFRDLVVCLMVFGIVLSLVILGGHGNAVTPTAELQERDWYEDLAKAGQKGWGANLDAPADRDTPDYPARPEWYFLFLFQLLKEFPGEQILIGTFYIPAGVMLLLFLLPLLGIGRMRKFGHFIGILVVVALLASVATLTVHALIDDSPDPILLGMVGNRAVWKDKEQFELAKDDPANDESVTKAAEFRHKLHDAHHKAVRAAQLAMDGVPAEGARALLRNDPLTKGVEAFKTQCAACHAYTASAEEKALGFKGITKETADDPAKAVFKASNLGGWGTKEWILGLIANPSDPKYFGLTNLKGMINWRKGVERDRARAIKKDKTEADKIIVAEESDFDTVAEFLADQAQPKEKRNQELGARGLKLFEGYCGSCHRCGELGEELAPDLTGYGSAEWLRLMIMSPGHKLRHGEKNEMPACRNLDGPGAEVYKMEFLESSGQKAKLIHLTDLDRELIIRLVTRDHRVVFGGQPVSGPPKRK
jgi:ubiquinol-cytochrome c reductase cytochrome b subunit